MIANARQGGIADVVRLFQSGNLAGARTRGSALLATQPNDPGLLHLLGLIYCQSGDPAQGAHFLKRSLRLKPGDVVARRNLARALLDAGENGEAEAVSAADAGDPILRRFHADALKKQARWGEAITVYRRLVAAHPDDFESWNNLGNTLLETDDVDAALAAFERAGSLQPGNALIQRNLGEALAMAGRHDESVDALERARSLAPNDATVLLELGRALNRVGRSNDALPILGDAARIDPKNAEILMTIGLTFAGLGIFDRAEQGYRFALQADPSSAQAYLNLGVLLEQANRIDELDALIGEATVRGVNSGEILFLRALSGRRRGTLESALELALAVSAETVDDILRNQLIGQLADRRGQIDIAFAAFTAMNRAMADEPLAARFDGTEHARYVDGLTAMTTTQYRASWPSCDLPSSPPAPVFLVGFPRSGTTLLDTVLMGHAGTHVLEEEPVVARVHEMLGDLRGIASLHGDQVRALRARYFEELQAISPPPPGALVIDKLPLNILRIPLIHRIFPDAKFIFAARHPCDVVLSCFMQNFKVNQAMASFLDLGNTATFYDRVLGYWARCQQIFPLTTHVVRYENMVSDIEGEMVRLLEFLDLPWDRNMLDHQQTAANRDFIRTPSYAQVTEKIYDRAQGRWYRYRHHMADVLPVLAPWVEQLGYPSITDEREL